MLSPDEENILKESQGFLEAWNKGDAKAAASFYTEDGVRVGAFGDIAHGHAELENAFTKLLHNTMPGARVKQENESVKMLTNDYALWQGNIEIERPGGASPLKGYVVQVMKKVQNRWLVLEAHPKFFPPR
ncbi:MAG: YybH family protein [Sphingobacteriales bacterium]